MYIFNFSTSSIARKNARIYDRKVIEMLLERDIGKIVDVTKTMSDAELKQAIIKNARYAKSFINWGVCGVVYSGLNKKQKSIVNNLHKKFRIAIIR